MSGGECASALRAAAMTLRHSERGQASVELVAMVPLIVAVAGHAVWSAGAAARAAARAEAVGGDTDEAARRLLPKRVRGEAKIDAEDDGEVRVAVPIPAVVGGGSLFTTTARARFEPQR